MDPERLQPEEADCDLIEVQGGYHLEGYDADALTTDYPLSGSSFQESEYIQRLAELWHGRYAFHNACFHATYDHVVVLGVPHPRRFVDRGIPFVGVPSTAFAPIVAVGKDLEAKVGVCVMAIDLFSSSSPQGEGEEEEEEDSFRAVHVGSFPYTEFIWSLEPCLEKEVLVDLYECWDLVSQTKRGKKGKGKEKQQEWISVGCVDVTSPFWDREEEEKEESPFPIPEEELTEVELKKRKKLTLERLDRQHLRQWLPDHRCIPQKDRPRTLWRAYNGGFVPAYTRLKDEAQEYAGAMGLGCFAYDFYKFNKRYLIATWDAAYRIVARGDTYTRPRGDRALCKERRGRHLYEGMLPEFPQKLILDLEFYREKNPDLDTDEMTRYAIEYTSRFLQKLFDYAPEEGDWIILDASSEGKASRHVILNAPHRYFSNMHDATYFRDIMKAYMEAGIMTQDASVTRLLVQANPKKDAHGAVCDLPIADQVKIEDKWYTSFIDWSIVNHSFRLMRTYRATKYGDDRRPFREASMNKQHYENDRDLFVNSLVSSVFPLPDDPKDPAPGWEVSVETAQKTIQELRALLVTNGVVSSAFEPLVNHETRQSLGKRKRRGVSSVGGPRKWTQGYLRKHELDASALQHGICVRVAQDARPDLDQLIDETQTWRVWAVCDSTKPEECSFTYPKYYYIASRESAYCPVLGNNHSNKGKMIIIINRQGLMSAKCLGGSCQGQWWKLGNQRLSRRVLDHLWPEALVPGRETDRF